MIPPDFEQLQGDGYISIRKTEGKNRNGDVQTIEVLKRESDDTYWWVHRSGDVTARILQVEPVTILGKRTYHEVKRNSAN